ncbi:hypothetical protein ACH4UM_29610 [Streptomyces sp. NPDC020801]|uniref:hypothetical protein n=1 Tax=Streptomyces sp. NPDC020801 TaxID=3365093 RepID=UPI0037985B3D
MTVDQLPDPVREFANHLDGLLARLDQRDGWCAVFWQRDPDGMRACLHGREVPPWDVLEAVLQDLAGQHGPVAAASERERVRALYAAAVAAYDARPGARDALGDRLDVMLREQSYAAERRAQLSRRLATAATPEEADALRTDLAWTHDDHERARARCAELDARLAALDGREAGDVARGARPGHEHERGHEPGGGPARDGAHLRVDAGDRPAGRGARVAGCAGAAEPGVRVPGRPGSAGRGAWAGRDDGAGRLPSTAEADGPAPVPTAPPPGRPEYPEHPDHLVGGPGTLPSPPTPIPTPMPASTPTPTSAPHPPKSRKRRRGSARFAGMAEEEAAPVVVPPSAATPTQAAPAPSPTVGRTPRGARFAGAAAEATERPRPRTGPEDAGAARTVALAVEALGRLRAEGRSGEAHALLVEAAHWPAGRLPLLAAGLERAGLAADWTTLLWETASLPAGRLVAAADALVAAGRAEDGQQILRQGVVRPAAEMGEAVLALLAEGRDREVRVLLDAYVRVRTPEQAVRSAEPAPGRLVPLLLEAARGVSDERHWDLVHAFRVAGVAT